MSVNISVSGKTLKECHEQILALANEITGDMKESVKDPIVSQSQSTPRFPIQPESNVTGFSNGSMSPSNVEVGDNRKTSMDNGTGLDSRGLPWDERIHSSSKDKGKDGVWRRRRGVDPAIEAAVEAELYAKNPSNGSTNMGNQGNTSASNPVVKPFGSMSPEQYQQAVQPAAPAPMPTTEHRVSLPVGPDVLSTAQIPATPAPTFAPPAMQVLPPNTFTPESFRKNLMNVLNDLAAAGKINHDWINAQKVQFGGKDVTQWHENAEACNSLFEAFVGWGLVNKL